MPDNGGATTAIPTRSARRRRWIRLGAILSLIGLLSAAALAATALTPTLGARHPLVLLALSARDRNLLLAHDVDILAFTLVATARRFANKPLFFWLGREYESTARGWLAQRHGVVLRAIERLFHRAPYLVVAVYPGTAVCVWAGLAGMPPVIFLPLAFTSTVVGVLLVREVGHALGGPLDVVVEVFDRYIVLATTITTVATVAVVIAGYLIGRHHRVASVPGGLER